MTPRLVMMGTGTFARPTFGAIIAHSGFDVVGLVTQPDRTGSQQRGSTRQTGASLKEIAEAQSIPVYQPESVNTPEGIAKLKEWKPDLLVVAAYGQILKKEVLEAARWGGINVHGSLLPKYRGAAPVAHAILNGETTTGVTIIRMTTGLDAGDMLAQESLEIGPDETAGELETRLATQGAGLAVDVIARARNEEGISALPATTQDPALVTKAPKLKKEHGLIDWSKPAERIVNHIRAMQPWPTAYTFLRRASGDPFRVIVNKAIVSEPPASAGGESGFTPPADAGGSPGTVLTSGQRFFVIAGTRTVEILELQPAGKKRMTAAEFLRGHPIQEGNRFGPE